MSASLADIRREYDGRALDASDMLADPIEQFRRWLDEAIDAGLVDPNAMTLATASPDGRPSARVVLLKGVDDRGFTFFTNYNSRKARELDDNPHAALVFWWEPLHRQVRVEGTVSRVAPEESDRYHHSRPRGSQLGAWASPQSEVIPGRDVLERHLEEATARFADTEVPRPPYWGGYRVEPVAVEFWQGRPNRLHDRFRYSRTEGGTWRLERLAP